MLVTAIVVNKKLDLKFNVSSEITLRPHAYDQKYPLNSLRANHYIRSPNCAIRMPSTIIHLGQLVALLDMTINNVSYYENASHI